MIFVPLDPDLGSGRSFTPDLRANQQFVGLKYLKSLSIDKKILFWLKKMFLVLDAGSEIPGGKNRIREKHPGSATLQNYECEQRTNEAKPP